MRSFAFYCLCFSISIILCGCWPFGDKDKQKKNQHPKMEPYKPSNDSGITGIANITDRPNQYSNNKKKK